MYTTDTSRRLGSEISKGWRCLTLLLVPQVISIYQSTLSQHSRILIRTDSRQYMSEEWKVLFGDCDDIILAALVDESDGKVV